MDIISVLTAGLSLTLKKRSWSTWKSLLVKLKPTTKLRAKRFKPQVLRRNTKCHIPTYVANVNNAVCIFPIQMLSVNMNKVTELWNRFYLVRIVQRSLQMTLSCHGMLEHILEGNLSTVQFAKSVLRNARLWSFISECTMERSRINVTSAIENMLLKRLCKLTYYYTLANNHFLARNVQNASEVKFCCRVTW